MRNNYLVVVAVVVVAVVVSVGPTILVYVNSDHIT